MPLPTTLFRTLPALTLACLLAACATKPPATDAEATTEFNQMNDPLEPTNRFFYEVNDGIDTYFFRPLAVAYGYIPGAIRDPVHNVLANLSSPIIFSDDVLQTKPQRAGTTMMRFLINSTAGVGGLFDVADHLGYKRHTTDFGVTLALWGVGPGPFLFLPVLGPSDPRDATGFGVDAALDPFDYATFGGAATLRVSQFGLNAVDTRQRLIGTIEPIKRTALDPYATFRSLYRQNRESVIDETANDNKATIPAWFPQH